VERFLPRSPQQQRQRDATHSQHRLQHPSEAHKEKEEAAAAAAEEQEQEQEEEAAAGEEEGEQRAHEPFYLDVEPKGGWTMTDLVGFPFASDIDMLHHRWQPNSQQVLLEP
jgi:hypothetical protein